MTISNQTTDEAILIELGVRLTRQRLAMDLTQADLAQEAGLSKRTIERIEAGKTAQTASLIRILRALKLLSNIEALIPPPTPSPIEQLKLQGQQRQRASRTSSKAVKPQRSNEPWKWGDEK